MIGVGSTSLFLASAVLLSYICGTKYANRAATFKSVIGVFISVIKIIMFSVVGGLFYGQSTKIPPGGQESLWSVSCNASDSQKAVFGKVINLGQICAMQVVSSFPRACPPEPEPQFY